MDFTQPIEDIVEEIAKYVVDLYVDEDDIREIVQYCRENGIATKSDFENECTGRGLLRHRWLNFLMDGAFQYIHAKVIYLEDGIDILNTTNAWSGWNRYFSLYGQAYDVSELGEMVLKYKFEEYGGYDAIIDNLYSLIEDDLN